MPGRRRCSTRGTQSPAGTTSSNLRHSAATTGQQTNSVAGSADSHFQVNHFVLRFEGLQLLRKCSQSLNMDSNVRRLAILLVFHLSLLCTMENLSRDVSMISLWHWQQLCCVTVAVQGLRGVRARRPRRLWAHKRGMGQPGFFDQNLLSSFNAREFKAHMRMDVSTFEYLCSTLAPSLQKQDTNTRSAIPVQVKVAIAISRLAIGNSMQTITDLYRIGLSTSQLAVTQFTSAIKTILLKKFIRWPSTSTMEKFAREFENLH